MGQSRDIWYNPGCHQNMGCHHPAGHRGGRTRGGCLQVSCATSRPATRPVSASQGHLPLRSAASGGVPPFLTAPRWGAAKEKQSTILSRRARPGACRRGPSLRHKLVPSGKPQFPHLDGGGKSPRERDGVRRAKLSRSKGAMPTSLLSAAFVPGVCPHCQPGDQPAAYAGTRVSLRCSA